MRFYIRIEGILLEVHPMTKATRDNPTLKIMIVRSRAILRVFATDIITDY